MVNPKKKTAINSFDFQPGQILANKYEVIFRLGAGWEGEVYLVEEKITGIERAAKFFFPQRNRNNVAFKYYAQKLHKLRHCPILIQYNGQDSIQFQGIPVTFLISDYVEGELLSEYINRQRGKRLSAFQSLHLLHALAAGIESIHHMREYHGDLHTDNVILRRYGLSYDLKLIDMFYWKDSRLENIRHDVVSLIKIFYEALGGKKYYSSQPKEVKDICCGLKRSLILKKFRTAGQLREYLETMQWE